MEQIILFTSLILFPFGQIIRIGIIHPLDIVVGIGALWVVYNRYTKPKVFKYIDNFLIIAFFSWLFSLFYFKDIKIFYGLLYLIRLCAYFYFSVLVYHIAYSVKHKQSLVGKAGKALILNSLLYLSLISSLFGWIQFFMFPDIKAFFTFGWDEHLYRLVGTFLDPTFLGLIITFGALISIYKKKHLLFIFLIFSLIFTYSRASYLALFASLLYIVINRFISKKFLIVIPIFLFLVFLIPTTKNKSISFFRTYSTHAKLQNYINTIQIFKTSPVFGIGYNNLCFTKNKFIEPESYNSHACSGSDSSLLYVLATTGVLGFIVFVNLLYNLWKTSNILFRSLMISALIHSCFSNSLFYPWILFYLIIVYSLLRTEVDS